MLWKGFLTFSLVCMFIGNVYAEGEVGMEIIPNFEDEESLDMLNEELRRLRTDVNSVTDTDTDTDTNPWSISGNDISYSSGDVEIDKSLSIGDDLTLSNIASPSGAVYNVVVDSDGTVGKSGASYGAAIPSVWHNSGTQVYSLGAAPANFTDLDLSSVVGSNYALVMLVVKNSTGSNDVYYAFRQDDEGTAVTLNSHAGCAQVDHTEKGYVMAATDETGVVEWKASNANNAEVWVQGYIK